MKIKLKKKIMFNGIGGITFYPGTLMKMICRASDGSDVVFCSPISKRTRNQVYRGFKDWLDAGFPFKSSDLDIRT